MGGLRYLLSGSEVRCESLLPDVHLAGTNDGSLVQTADRPGIEKVTFVRHPFGSLNGEFRAIHKPLDGRLLWLGRPCVSGGRTGHNRARTFYSAGRDFGPGPEVTRTGTTNWANNADLNDNSGGAGPGVIQPPITLTFNTGGPFYLNLYDPATFFNGLALPTPTFLPGAASTAAPMPR